MACFCTNTVFVLDPDLYLSIRIRLLLYKSGSGTASLDTGLLTSWKSIRLIRISWDSNYFAGSGCDRTNFILLIVHCKLNNLGKAYISIIQEKLFCQKAPWA